MGIRRACRATMSRELHDDSAFDPLSSNGGEPLVPILRVDEGKVDPLALATWHEALSNTVAVEVPHDLMGLWLYPAQGGTVLLGPAALAEDDLVVPVPAPYLKQEQLAVLEEIVADAGYLSATCLPVRFGKRDVALLLVAGLQSDRYGGVERVVLQCVAQRIAPMLGRIARQWTPAEGATSRQQERIAGLLQAVANANRDASTPQRFMASIGRGLAPLLPHEHIELLVSNESETEYFRLGEHPGGPLWTDPSLVISPELLDISAIFGARSQLLVPDTYEDDRWPRGFLTAVEPAGADIRGIVGARMSLRGHPPAYLLVGSIGPDIYEAADVELLVLLSGLVLPQVGEFLRAPSPEIPAPKPSDRGPAEQLLRIAGALGTAADVATATRLVAHEGKKILPFDTMVFALSLSDKSRAALLQPDERRATLTSVAGTPLERVLAGELPGVAIVNDAGRSQLIVPLKGAGRVHGAMVFTAGPGTLLESHMDLAHQLADIVASHLELLRRAALRTPPYVPGWKRKEKA